MRRQSVRFVNEPTVGVDHDENVGDGSDQQAEQAVVLRLAKDPTTLAVLATPESRERIIGALRAQDEESSGFLEPGAFRRALFALKVGLGAVQVESLLQAVLWIGQQQQPPPSAGQPPGKHARLVQYELLFSRESASSAEPAGLAISAPQLDQMAAPVQTSGEPGGETKMSSATGDDSPPPPLLPPPHCPTPPSAPLVSGVQSHGELKEKHATRQAKALRFRLPSVESLSHVDPSCSTSPTLSATTSRSSIIGGEEEAEEVASAVSPQPQLPNAVIPDSSTGAKGGNFGTPQRKRRMRLGSVEELLFDMPVGDESGTTMRRATMPALELLETTGADTDIAMNLSAYSSIGVTSVFFASLSLSTIHALMGVTASQGQAIGHDLLLNVTFATHAMVVVLNIFTVLTMSMIYYYGQLHIGHGLNETAKEFVQRNQAVKKLRRYALDAFWASAPLFMAAMALTFLSQYELREASASALVIPSVFAAGILVSISSVITVLHAHRSEVELWELATRERTK